MQSPAHVTSITSFPARGANLVLSLRRTLVSPFSIAAPVRQREVTMNFSARLTSNLHYGRQLFRSAMAGAHSGEEQYLHGKPFHLFMDASASQALKPAVVAALLGALGGFSGSRHRSPARTLAYGMLGGTIGFGAGLAWQSRGLTSSVATAVWKRVGRTRDEHWLESNPIDYA